MRRRKSNIGLPLFLLLVCGALAWAIFRQLAMTPQLEAETHGNAAAPNALPELPREIHFEVTPIEEFQAVLERPLFSPSRRPALEETVEAPKSTKDVAFALKGIVIDGDERIAVLMPKTNGKAVRLREGETMQGWTLVRIELDHVALAQGDTETILEPSFAPAAPKRRQRRQNNAEDENQQ